MDKEAKARLDEIKQIAHEYTLPGNLVDNGNLFYALTEALQIIEREMERSSKLYEIAEHHIAVGQCEYCKLEFETLEAFDKGSGEHE